MFGSMTKSVSIRKRILFAAILCCLMFACAAASAQTFTFDSIHAKIDLPDDYILMTPDTLGQHAEWAAAQGTTADELAEQWAEDGVLAVAEAKDGERRYVVSAVQDTDAESYFDLDQQNSSARSAWRKKHLNDEFASPAYTFSSAEWKKADRYGRMLSVKYKADAWRGFAYRTIRNGHTITVDCQVRGRSLKNADGNALAKIMKTFAFSQVEKKPEDAVVKMTFTEGVPAETDTGKFTVAGTCEPGLRIVGVMMRMSSSEKILVEDTASSKGKFSLDVKLPSEGVWLMTMTAYNGDTIVDEKVFDTTTYSATLLPVNFDAEIGGAVESDELKISGTTLKNVTVQCIIESTGYEKLVKTNNSGRFSFKLDTSKEGEYEIIVVLQKKNYTLRRFTYTVTRSVTEEERKADVRKAAVKPAYSTLNAKIAGYTGRVMGYSLYYVSAAKAGEEWVVRMAMKSSESGYKNIVCVLTDEAPGFTEGQKVKMYGTCTGTYVDTDGETEKTYPEFRLLFWD